MERKKKQMSDYMTNVNNLAEEKKMILLCEEIFDQYLINLKDWDLEFMISILNNIVYRRNKIRWDKESKERKSS